MSIASTVPQICRFVRNTSSYAPISAPKGDVETRRVLKLCIEARAVLAELKQAGELIHDQGILINTIPLLEAQASSAIENIVTT
jgi:Fic family protein